MEHYRANESNDAKAAVRRLSMLNEVRTVLRGAAVEYRVSSRSLSSRRRFPKAAGASTLALASAPALAETIIKSLRASDFVTLMKPRVMLLAVFTALVRLIIAPGHLDPLLGSIAILGIAAGAGAAGVLNMWYDADIDAVMTRTARRPIPRGKVSSTEALAFGLALARARFS